ncbi:class I SAM-dependent methyltransferase [Bacteriovorax sp. DB6_IX]|uniref:class I SAM-dependent methyltransferase n=1 Tax=Bacteriovorax sp. DB6_IX TaxID=1353530 RepID=UPI00038A5362|nr:class I SAM-dependent methyltransferase [Bacteriovorax sp. DB6_IX]EQC52828.1 hypothetical protein M901_1028 [Bacteriovorax sp. DB6_IX]
MTKKNSGAQGFHDEYWKVNYQNPEEMDGIGNVEMHVGYIKNLFGMEYIDISSIVDLGFGLGHLFEGLLKEFIPYKALGIEPSEFAFKEVEKREISPADSTNFKLQQIDLVSWCQSKKKIKSFDLGICTSVFQYLSDEEIEFCLPILAQRCKYLYFTVPTDKELIRQIEDLEFKDEYAIRRSRTKYQKMIKKHFTFISSRVLESKVHFNEENTFFTDLLYRF